MKILNLIDVTVTMSAPASKSGNPPEQMDPVTSGLLELGASLLSSAVQATPVDAICGPAVDAVTGLATEAACQAAGAVLGTVADVALSTAGDVALGVAGDLAVNAAGAALSTVV